MLCFYMTVPASHTHMRDILGFTLVMVVVYLLVGIFQLHYNLMVLKYVTYLYMHFFSMFAGLASQ
jgi:hypothetical protein